MTVTACLWITFFLMAAGFAVLTFMSRSTSEEEGNLSVIHALVPAIAAVFYLLMAVGSGSVLLDGGARTFYFARYIDWSFTTPLLLIGLGFTALGSLKGRMALIGGLVGTDILMIVTGFFAGGAHAGSTAKWAWYLISCGFFAGVYYILWGPLLKLARARSADIARVYTRNAGILSVLWLLYPVVFLLGSDGVGVVAPIVAISAYAVLDLLAKVAYGLLASSEGRKRSAA